MLRILQVSTLMLVCGIFTFIKFADNPTADSILVYSEEEKEMAFQKLEPFYNNIGDFLLPKEKQSEGKHRPSLCFHPDTDEAYIEATYKNTGFLDNSLGNGLGGEEKANVATWWGSTATDGGGISQGDAITLTWSYVPDGTNIGHNCFNNTGDVSDFLAFFDGIYGGPTTPGDYTTSGWHVKFVDMFADWSAKSGLSFVYEPNDDGVDYAVNTGANPGVLGTRGDMRIGGDMIDGNNGILACNYFPSVGDMIIDTDDIWYSNNSGLGVDNVLAHEIGHGLGFSHVCPVEQTKLMEPFVSTAFDGPQEDDILAVNRNYGDVNNENDDTANATDLGPIANGTDVCVECQSIDDEPDEYY